MNSLMLKQLFTFDKCLQLPSNMVFVGATMSGKTTLFLQSLENAEKIYNPPPEKVLFMYHWFQPTFLTLKENLMTRGIQMDFIQASNLTEKDLREISNTCMGQILIAIDDSMIASSKSKNLAHLFTISRHFRCSIVLFWHSIFLATPESRLISQNTAYYFLMNSPRMGQQVANLGSQLNLRKALLSAYADACQKPYGYVLIDLRVTTPDFLRLRGRVFDDKIQYAYVSEMK